MATSHSNVYAASSELFFAADLAGAITHFTTDATGDLIFDGCIGGTSGCAPVGSPFAPVSFAAAGGQLYALSAADSGAIFHSPPARPETWRSTAASGTPRAAPRSSPSRYGIQAA